MSNEYWPQLYKLGWNDYQNSALLQKYDKFRRQYSDELQRKLVPALALMCLAGCVGGGLLRLQGEGIQAAVFSLLIGAGFGGGLILSGMTQPNKIRSFLDPYHGLKNGIQTHTQTQKKNENFVFLCLSVFFFCAISQSKCVLICVLKKSNGNTQSRNTQNTHTHTDILHTCNVRKGVCKTVNTNQRHIINI